MIATKLVNGSTLLINRIPTFGKVIFTVFRPATSAAAPRSVHSPNTDVNAVAIAILSALWALHVSAALIVSNAL